MEKRKSKFRNALLLSSAVIGGVFFLYVGILSCALYKLECHKNVPPELLNATINAPPETALRNALRSFIREAKCGTDKKKED